MTQRCTATNAAGGQCGNYAMKDRDDGLCHYHAEGVDGDITVLYQTQDGRLLVGRKLRFWAEVPIDQRVPPRAPRYTYRGHGIRKWEDDRRDVGRCYAAVWDPVTELWYRCMNHRRLRSELCGAHERVRYREAQSSSPR